MSKRLSSTATLLFIALLSSALPTSQARAEVVIDMTKPIAYGLSTCDSPAESECIESVEVKNENGEFKKASLVRDNSGEIEYTDDFGEIQYSKSTLWQTQYGNLELNSEVHGYEKTIFGTQKGAVLRIYLGVADKPLLHDKEFRVTFRENVITAMNVQLGALNAKYSVDRIGNTRRWVVSGSPIKVAGYNNLVLIEKKDKDGNTFSEADWSRQADFDNVSWGVNIHHADQRPGYGYFPDPGNCAKDGFSVTSFNAAGAGDPSWDASSDSLNFAIAGPATRSDGSKNTGYFYFSTSHKYLDCKFKENTLSSTSKLVLEIIAEDGTNKVATTSIVNKANKLEFVASGFSYSSPKVVLREVSASTPVITCVKGKQSKTLPPAKSKCPKGWKKK